MVQITRGVLLALLVVAALLVPARPTAAQSQMGVWRDTGLRAQTLRRCFDTSRPHMAYVISGHETVVYDWQQGQVWASLPNNGEIFCGPNGLMFFSDGSGGTLRFNLETRETVAVAHRPTLAARDGTMQLYAREGARLWYSADGGITWDERRLEFAASLKSVVMAPADARVLYAATLQSPNYAIYISYDTGRTWTRRFSGSNPNLAVVSLAIPEGGIGPADMLLMIQSHWQDGSHRTGQSVTMELSGDGGRSFRSVYAHIPGGPPGLHQVDRVAYSADGLLHLSYSYWHRAGQPQIQFSLRLTRDDGASWHNLPLPAVDGPETTQPELTVARTAPSSLLLRDYTGRLWYSSDNGQSWHELGEQPALLTPYLPLSAVRLSEGRLEVADLPVDGRLLTRTAPAAEIPGASYFPETGHNLSGAIKRYWENNGGLAQFGYPKTEPILELNPADGKLYVVQYFERSRLEYHPELAGTRYEVLLGLLGNQLTAEHRQPPTEDPFRPVTGTRFDDQLLFKETGHTLRGAFRKYWEANGGLEIYGYPISEEFHELNPDDGRVYIVQYFERARFEWHPENQGTRYEVLLGLLGNMLLRQKGWQ